MSTVATPEREAATLTDLDARAVGERIALARHEAGLHQKELAERIGVIPRSVQNYEAGRIPWRYLTAIAEATGRTKEWLLYGDATTPAAGPTVEERLDRVESLVEEILARLPERNRE